jgi:hypothetical protein
MARVGFSCGPGAGCRSGQRLRPYCAKGQFHRLPVNVQVYARKRCGSIDRYVYTKLRYRIRGRLPSWLRHRTGAAPFPCRIYD